MKGDSIPESDHISRYCGGSHVDGDTISGTAFMLKDNESSLSVNWLEILRCQSRNEAIQEIRNIMANKRFQLKKSARIAVHNAGTLIKTVKDKSPDSRVLSCLHEPARDDFSHSGIYGLKADDELIADLIATCIKEIHPAAM